MRVFIDAPLLIYLNAIVNPNVRAPYENFYVKILSEYKPYTDVLVLDEVIYVSKRKYNIPYKVSIDFLNSLVLPYITILDIGEDDFELAAKILLEYNVKPSDAIHLGVMLNNGINIIVSEDKELDKVQTVKRLWL